MDSHRLFSSRPLACSAVLAALCAGFGAARAQGTNGQPLCDAAGAQTLSAVRYSSPVPDGANGAIAVWEDHRSGYDIYVQRMSAYGSPLWAPNGLALCAGGVSRAPQIATDGAGGAFVVWSDARTGSGYDLFAQRVDAGGVPQWAANGVTLAADIRVGSPRIVPDGSLGAIVVWNDNGGGVTTGNVRGQRVDASGAAQWAAGGVALCDTAHDQVLSGIVSDGAGGAIVTWFDLRSGTNFNIYAQRMDADGVPRWTAGGVPVCTASGDQMNALLASDGAGGAIATWHDARSGNSNQNIYAQRLSADGVPMWTADGVALCTSSNNQLEPTIVTDGAGGAILTWYDLRGGSRYDIYAQRVNSAGMREWAANGVAVCTATDNQLFPRIASVGAGGVIITWEDDRARNNAIAESQSDIYAQRLNASGARQWAANGVALCSAPLRQSFPAIASDEAGGAIVTWDDPRSGASLDVYTHHVNAAGQVLAVPPGTTTPPLASRAWPNPFHERVRIGFTLPARSAVRLEVLDVIGRRVSSLPPALLDAGAHTLDWDGREEDGRRAAAGIYFLAVHGAGGVISGRVVRLE